MVNQSRNSISIRFIFIPSIQKFLTVQNTRILVWWYHTITLPYHKKKFSYQHPSGIMMQVLLESYFDNYFTYVIYINSNFYFKFGNNLIYTEYIPKHTVSNSINIRWKFLEIFLFDADEDVSCVLQIFFKTEFQNFLRSIKFSTVGTFGRIT